MCDIWEDIIWASGWEPKVVGLQFTQDGSNTPSNTIDYNSTMLQDSATNEDWAVDPQEGGRRQLVAHLELDAEIYSLDVKKYAKICADIQVLSVCSREGPELCMYWVQWLSQLPHKKLRTIVFEPIVGDHIAYPVAHSTFILRANAPMLSMVYFQGRITEGFLLSGMKNLASIILDNSTMSNAIDYACFADALSGACVEYVEVKFAIRDYAKVEGPFMGTGTTVNCPRLRYLAVTNLPSAHAIMFLRMFNCPALRRLFLSVRMTVNTRFIYEHVEDVDEDFPVDAPAGPGGDSLASVESLELHICHVTANSAPRCRSDIRRSKVVCIVLQLAKHLPSVQELVWEAGAHCMAKLMESAKFTWAGLRTLWLWEAHILDNPPIQEILEAPDYSDHEPIKVNEYGAWESMRAGICTDVQVQTLIRFCHWRGIDVERVHVERGIWRASGRSSLSATEGGLPISTMVCYRPSYEHREVSRDYSRMHDEIVEEPGKCPSPNNSWPTKWISVSWTQTV